VNTSTATSGKDARPSAAELRSVVERYRRPSHSRAIWQLTNTLLPYLLGAGNVIPSLIMSLTALFICGAAHSGVSAG